MKEFLLGTAALGIIVFLLYQLPAILSFMILAIVLLLNYRPIRN